LWNLFQNECQPPEIGWIVHLLRSVRHNRFSRRAQHADCFAYQCAARLFEWQSDLRCVKRRGLELRQCANHHVFYQRTGSTTRYHTKFARYSRCAVRKQHQALWGRSDRGAVFDKIVEISMVILLCLELRGSYACSWSNRERRLSFDSRDGAVVRSSADRTDSPFDTSIKVSLSQLLLA
jgi:hypothetical protein